MLCLMAFHRAINHQLGSGFRSFADSRFRLALIKTVLEPSLSIYFPLIQDFSTLPFFAFPSCKAVAIRIFYLNLQ